MADLYIALLHHPVVDRNARIVTAAITSLDIHDLARSARTYEARGFFVVHPVAEQREFAARVIEHWFEEPGRAFDSRREEALRLARVVATLDEALTVVHHESGARPILVSTSARNPTGVSFRELREKIETPDGPPIVLLFGTGFGLAPEILNRADIALAPVRGPGNYNHLSVRAAVAAILDRLRGV